MQLIKVFNDNHNKLVKYCLYLAVFFLPIDIWFNSLFILISFLITVLSKKQRYSYSGNLFMYISFAWFLLFLISIPFVKDVSYLLKHIETNYLFVSIPIVLFSLISIRDEDVFHYFCILYFACVIYFIISLFNVIELAGIEVLFSKHTSTYLLHYHDIHHSYFGLFVAISSLSILKKSNVVSFLILFVINLLILIILRGKMSILIYLLGVVLINIKNFNNQLKFIGLLFLLSIPAIFLLKENLIILLNERIYIWENALDVIFSNFLFGVDPSRVQAILAENAQNNEIVSDMSFNMNAHNQFLTSFLYFGIFGFVFISLFFLIPLYYSIKKRDSNLLVFLVLLFISFQTESFLLRQQGIVFSLFFLSLLISKNK
ncbi:O-antigen ligase [Flammeovirga sp. SJP92]|uniref:O-antigen ligase family protein n=1 Tax=Flammeovirga sp. SJP92 TaxID=1775430 RepID=UPI00078717F9|nr:O-antigen ligase family protein [Flammeovirga sp. SJP92]KXX68575.1 hypothetical protein AVL50_22715 [Flammeovirga sp. SJP92]